MVVGNHGMYNKCHLAGLSSSTQSSSIIFSIIPPESGSSLDEESAFKLIPKENLKEWGAISQDHLLDFQPGI